MSGKNNPEDVDDNRSAVEFEGGDDQANGRGDVESGSFADSGSVWGLSPSFDSTRDGVGLAAELAAAFPLPPPPPPRHQNATNYDGGLASELAAAFPPPPNLEPTSGDGLAADLAAQFSLPNHHNEAANLFAGYLVDTLEPFHEDPPVDTQENHHITDFHAVDAGATGSPPVPMTPADRTVQQSRLSSAASTDQGSDVADTVPAVDGQADNGEKNRPNAAATDAAATEKLTGKKNQRKTHTCTSCGSEKQPSNSEIVGSRRPTHVCPDTLPSTSKDKDDNDKLTVDAEKPSRKVTTSKIVEEGVVKKRTVEYIDVDDKGDILFDKKGKPVKKKIDKTNLETKDAYTQTPIPKDGPNLTPDLQGDIQQGDKVLTPTMMPIFPPGGGLQENLCDDHDVGPIPDPVLQYEMLQHYEYCQPIINAALAGTGDNDKEDNDEEDDRKPAAKPASKKKGLDDDEKVSFRRACVSVCVCVWCCCSRLYFWYCSPVPVVAVVLSQNFAFLFLLLWWVGDPRMMISM
jgi:hypothetical protein